MRQLWKIGQNLPNCHSAGKVIENVSDSNARTADARFTATFAWFNGNDVLVIHTSTIIGRFGTVNLFRLFFCTKDHAS